MEENNGTTLGDILKPILKVKWLVLIITAVITLVGTLIINFAYNPTDTYYSMDFSLLLPEDDGNVIYTYPDGKKMHFADIVAADALAEVKQSDPDKFKDIDVSKIIDKSAIGIARNVTVRNSENAVPEVTYTITLKSQFVKDYNIARQFLTELASRPIKYLSSLETNHFVYYDLSEKADDYESELELLESQLDYVISEFEKLSETYGENFKADGKSITAHLNEIIAYKDKDRLGSLAIKVREEGILKNESVISEYEMKLKDLTKQRDLAQATLDNLLSTGSSSQGNVIYVDATVIKQQSDLVESLKQQIKTVNKYITDKNVDSTFETRYIKTERDVIKAYTETLKSVASEAYVKSSAVTFLSVNAVVREGGISLVVSILISLFVGVVISLIAGYVTGKVILNKKEQSIADVVTEPAPQTDKE